MPLINFSGLASGIDTESLIEATSNALRSQRIAPHQRKLDSLQDTNTALKELKTKFQKLQTLALGFTSLNGGALAKLAASTNESILTASASKSAPNGTYSMNVLETAKNGTLSFQRSPTEKYTSPTAHLNPAYDPESPDDLSEDTITIKIGTGSSSETVIVEGIASKTLNQFAAEFNEKSSKGQASIINAGTSGDPDYRIVITSNAEGVENGKIEIVALGSEVPPGVLATTASDEAANARFTIAGIGGEIERSSNTISNVIPGVSFTLNGTGAATINVTNDDAQTTANVQEFIEAFNELVQFINENNKITREENGDNISNIFGSLASTRVDDNALSAVRSAMSSSTYLAPNEDNAVRMFADLGITTDRDGTMKFDTVKLEQALSKEPESVNEILKKFADKAATTGGTIAQFVQFNGLFDLTVKGNEKQVTNLNDRIARAEASILRQEQVMRQRFARLEAVMGEMQNQQAALNAALMGLGFNNNNR